MFPPAPDWPPLQPWLLFWRDSPSSPAGPQALQRVNAKVDFTADWRSGRASVLVSDGFLLVAEEVKCGFLF
jgi:hypothetical protein